MSEKLEIELKFLVNENFDYLGFPKKEIEQAYLSITPDIRVRRIDNAFYRTSKGIGLQSRTENEIKITQLEYTNGVKNKISNLITKTRYFIPIKQGYIAELDVFKGNLLGLVTVEVEFDSIDDITTFDIPKWFGVEVTLNEIYKNKNLSLLEIEDILKEKKK